MIRLWARRVANGHRDMLPHASPREVPRCGGGWVRRLGLVGDVDCGVLGVGVEGRCATTWLFVRKDRGEGCASGAPHTTHELQAHHGHVALLNRPRAGPVLVFEVLLRTVRESVGCARAAGGSGQVRPRTRGPRTPALLVFWDNLTVSFVFLRRMGQLNRHTRYRPATTTRNTATQRSCHSVD